MDRTLVLVSACEARRSRRRTVAGPRIARKGLLRTDGQPPYTVALPVQNAWRVGKVRLPSPPPAPLTPEHCIVGARHAVPGVGANLCVRPGQARWPVPTKRGACRGDRLVAQGEHRSPLPEYVTFVRADGRSEKVRLPSHAGRVCACVPRHKRRPARDG
jgi:hypothetical protein